METAVVMKVLAGAVVGGVIGFAWYKLVGCVSGTCPITSHPWISTLYGAILGVLMVTAK